jgi:hypothetical protein
LRRTEPVESSQTFFKTAGGQESQANGRLAHVDETAVATDRSVNTMIAGAASGNVETCVIRSADNPTSLSTSHHIGVFDARESIP